MRQSDPRLPTEFPWALRLWGGAMRGLRPTNDNENPLLQRTPRAEPRPQGSVCLLPTTVVQRRSALQPLVLAPFRCRTRDNSSHAAAADAPLAAA